MPGCGCGSSSCGGGCGKSIIAFCVSNCNKNCNQFRRSSCSGRKGCRCNSCVTSKSILKDQVSPRSCCSSENASVYAFNVQTINIAANGNFSFDHVGEAHLIVPPGAGPNDATQFLLPHPGVYAYDFYVKGVAVGGSVPSQSALVVELLANGNPVNGSQYTSQDKEPSEAGNNHFVYGFGILQVSANTIIQVHNITGQLLEAVQLTSFPTGGLGSALAINVSLRIIRTC